MFEITNKASGVTKQYRTLADRIEAFTWRSGGVMDPVDEVVVNGVSVYPDYNGYYERNVIEATFSYDEPYYDAYGEMSPYDIDSNQRIKWGTYIGERAVWTVNMGPVLAMATSFGPVRYNEYAVGRVYFSFGNFQHALLRGQYHAILDTMHEGEFNTYLNEDTDNLVTYDRYLIFEDGTEAHVTHMKDFIVWGYAYNGILFHSCGIVPATVGSFVPNDYFESYSPHVSHVRPYISSWSSIGGPIFQDTTDEVSSEAVRYVCVAGT